MGRLFRQPCLLLLALLLVAAPALADTLPVPSLTGRVVDQAGILNRAEESSLTGKLKNLETQTSIQLVVVTLPSLRSVPIEEWGLTLGRTWGIGQKGQDNGVLLIVAPSDRELRIEVGYGLEGTMPDATANAIIRNVIVPRFKNGDMAGGISDGVDAIIAVLTGSGEEFIPSRREVVGQLLQQWAFPIFVGLVILMIAVSNFWNARRGRRGNRYFRNSRGGWLYRDDDDGYSDSGGFSSGGSSGGFSGGGGSFGGGGSSGRW